LLNKGVYFKLAYYKFTIIKVIKTNK